MKLTQKKLVEVNLLLHEMLLKLSWFFLHIGSARELIEDVLDVSKTTIELEAPGLGVSADPQDAEEPWVPSGVGSAALMLEGLRTALHHTSSDAVVDKVARGEIDTAVKSGLKSLKAARTHLKVKKRRPLNHVQAKQDLEEAERQGRVIGTILAARQSPVLASLLVEPTGSQPATSSPA